MEFIFWIYKSIYKDMREASIFIVGLTTIQPVTTSPLASTIHHRNKEKSPRPWTTNIHSDDSFTMFKLT